MIRSTNEVSVFAVNGRETPPLEMPKILVSSDWTDPRIMHLRFPGSETTYGVSARDLEAAIANAKCTGAR